jgi:hypothetical protein
MRRAPALERRHGREAMCEWNTRSGSNSLEVRDQAVEVTFAEGHIVHRSQVVLRVDPAVFSSQQRQARGIVSGDEALAARLRADHERNKSLIAPGFHLYQRIESGHSRPELLNVAASWSHETTMPPYGGLLSPSQELGRAYDSRRSSCAAHSGTRSKGSRA